MCMSKQRSIIVIAMSVLEYNLCMHDGTGSRRCRRGNKPRITATYVGTTETHNKKMPSVFVANSWNTCNKMRFDSPQST